MRLFSQPAFLKFTIYTLSLLLFSCGYSRENSTSAYKILNFSGNDFDYFPPLVYKAKGLEELYFGPKEMTSYGVGAINGKKNNIRFFPEDICKLQHLKVLDMTFNELVNLNNLECLINLEELNLSFNENLILKGNISIIQKLPMLKALIVLGTKFQLEDLEEIKKLCPYLQVISKHREYIDYFREKQKKNTTLL